MRAADSDEQRGGQVLPAVGGKDGRVELVVELRAAPRDYAIPNRNLLASR